MADTWENEYGIKKIEDAINFITESRIKQRKANKTQPNKKVKVKQTEEWVEKMTENIEEGFTTL